jgi:hypothetical protein
MPEIQAIVDYLVFVTRVCVIGKEFLRYLFHQVTLCWDSAFGRRRLIDGARREMHLCGLLEAFS